MKSGLSVSYVLEVVAALLAGDCCENCPDSAANGIETSGSGLAQAVLEL